LTIPKSDSLARTSYAQFESWAIDTITYPVRGLKHIKYALTCVENHTRLTYTFLMKKKSDAPRALRRLRNRVHQEHSCTLKHIYCDGALEFAPREVNDWLSQYHIKRTTTSPYVHWLNGYVELINRQYRQITRALLKGAHHPNFMWPAAHAYAQHVINARLTVGTTNQSPYQLAFGAKMDILNWQVYGTPCMVKTTETVNTKQLDDRATLGIYLGPIHCNPLIAVESPFSHAVLVEPGKLACIFYSGMVSFDSNWDSEAAVQDKFFCTAESGCSSDSGSVVSSFAGSTASTFNSISPDVARRQADTASLLSQAKVYDSGDIPVGQPLAARSDQPSIGDPASAEIGEGKPRKPSQPNQPASNRNLHRPRRRPPS
jgi:hypothetical protein